MTPVRALVEEREVDFAGLKASFKKYLKVLVFGVVLVEFQFDFGKPLNFQKLREAQMEMRIELVDSIKDVMNSMKEGERGIQTAWSSTARK